MITVRIKNDGMITYAEVEEIKSGLSTGKKIFDIDAEKFKSVESQTFVALGFAMKEGYDYGSTFVIFNREVAELWVGIKKLKKASLLAQLIQRCADLARQGGYFLYFDKEG